MQDIARLLLVYIHVVATLVIVHGVCKLLNMMFFVCRWHSAPGNEARLNPDSFKDVKEGGVCLSFGRADSVKDRWHAIELQSRDADDSDEANEFA